MLRWEPEGKSYPDAFSRTLGFVVSKGAGTFPRCTGTAFSTEVMKSWEIRSPPSLRPTVVVGSSSTLCRNLSKEIWIELSGDYFAVKLFKLCLCAGPARIRNLRERVTTKNPAITPPG